jgi:hypothetical protein
LPVLCDNEAINSLDYDYRRGGLKLHDVQFAECYFRRAVERLQFRRLPMVWDILDRMYRVPAYERFARAKR